MPGSGQKQSMGAAMRWASQVTSIGLELAIPVGGGAWCDQKYGTSPWLTILGTLIGSFLATQGLRQLIRDLDRE